MNDFFYWCSINDNDNCIMIYYLFLKLCLVVDCLCVFFICIEY